MYYRPEYKLQFTKKLMYYHLEFMYHYPENITIGIENVQYLFESYLQKRSPSYIHLELTPHAPSSVQPHGVRMIELVASSSPWLPSSTFRCLGPFLWSCKVSPLLPPMLSLIVCVHVYCCFNFFVMQMLNILFSKKLQKNQFFSLRKFLNFALVYQFDMYSTSVQYVISV